MSTERDIPPNGWEEELHGALKRLPDRPAPDTLLPRVMRAVLRRAHQPWYRRSWWQWPGELRALSASAGIALLAVLVWLIGLLPGAAANELTGTAAVGVIGDLPATVSEALAIALGSAIPGGANHLHLLLPCFALLLAAMYATCIGVGSAAYQFARSQRS